MRQLLSLLLCKVKQCIMERLGMWSSIIYILFLMESLASTLVKASLHPLLSV
jgi:hypothetical protein